MWLVSKSTDDCGYTFTTKNGMVSLDCNMAGVSSASSSHIAIRGTATKIQLPVKCCSQMDFKGNGNNGKDLLTNRKDPWAESKDLKGLSLKNYISKDLKGPKRTLGTLGFEHNEQLAFR